MGVALARMPRESGARRLPVLARKKTILPHPFRCPPDPSVARAPVAKGRLLALALWLLIVAPAARALADCDGRLPDRISDLVVGELGGFNADDAAAFVLSPPRGTGIAQGSLDVVSLGRSGRITLEFETAVIVDGPGPDFTVFENPFLFRPGALFAEPARVLVSTDGVGYVAFPCDLDDGENWFPGCAGVFPVFADAADPEAPCPADPPTISIQSFLGSPAPTEPPPGSNSGGDAFDLSDVGLSAVRFVRIESAPESFPAADQKGGFDLDSVVAIHWQPAADQDADGLDDRIDNCPLDPNAEQDDSDGDTVGDVCDLCVTEPDASNSDADEDGVGNVCDLCPDTFDPTNLDSDGDGVGDACDTGDDSDADGIADTDDNCKTLPNSDQQDTDGDGLGNACDLCPADFDPMNLDADADGTGDACEPPEEEAEDEQTPADENPAADPAPCDPSLGDADGDGLGDPCDTCPNDADATNMDADGDSVGDVCDPCPDDPDCGPLIAPSYAGGKSAQAKEAFLTFVSPGTKVTDLPRNASVVEVWINFAADVDPSTFRAKVRGADATARFSPIVPGSSRRAILPLAGKRTRVSFRIKGKDERGRRKRDVDRLIFRRRLKAN